MHEDEDADLEGQGGAGGHGLNLAGGSRRHNPGVPSGRPDGLVSRQFHLFPAHERAATRRASGKLDNSARGLGDNQARLKHFKHQAKSRPIRPACTFFRNLLTIENIARRVSACVTKS
jgi:hypothetical protein